MNGRIYDPLLGRFLSADVLVENPRNLQAYNRYAYAQNNPLTLTDPSGFMTIDEHKAKMEELWKQYQTRTANWKKLSSEERAATSEKHWGDLVKTCGEIGVHRGAIARIEWAADFHNAMVSGAEVRQGKDLGHLRVDASKIDDEAANGVGGLPHQTLLGNGDAGKVLVETYAIQAAGGTVGLLSRLKNGQIAARELSATETSALGAGRIVPAQPLAVPLGMKSGQLEAAFDRFRAAAGVDDAVVGLRGSATTGVSATRGPISEPADYDFFIVSDKLFQQGVAAGATPVDGALRVSATMRHFPAIHEAEQAVGASLGLKSTARIFSTEGFRTVQTGTEILSK